MSSCHTPDVVVSKAHLTVALAGNPNSGKTTIFNGLTGLRQKVANYPGVTVEKKTGRCKLPDGRWVSVIDLPGTYSLVSRSPDEQVAMEILRGLRKDTPAPDVVIVVVDASNLQRNLYLVSQLIELGRPMVVALNMMDVAERRGIRVSAARLQQQLGVPVVPVVGHRKQGIAELKEAIDKARIAPVPDWPLPEAMKEEVMSLGGRLSELSIGATPASPALDAAGSTRATLTSPLRDYQVLAERLIVGDHAHDLIDLCRQEQISSLLTTSTSRLTQLGIDPMQADIEAHYHWIENVAAGSLVPACENLEVPDTGAVLPYQPKDRTLTEKVDRVLLNPVLGLGIFGLIMAALFVTIFFIADPMMGFMEDSVASLGDVVTANLPDGPLKDLLVQGIFAGVGGVVVFVPQIALLFLFLAVLEDSGYLARAAFLMDKVFAKVGLHGKSFIPLLSSFACAIPGIMAARTIETRKDRLATIFVAPFMSCSARLPVYFLLIGTFFASYSAWVQGGILFGLYALGVVAAFVTAFVFKRTLLKGPAAAFILEMPTYKVPQLGQVARQVWTNTSAFLWKAGTIIFCLSVIIWAMMYYSPADIGLGSSASAAIQSREATEEPDAETARLRNSFAGRFGQVIEPVIRPLGYDWKMGVGLVGAFAAREVFVSTMGIVYSVGGDDEETQPLSEAMLADTYPDGTPVWTPVVAFSMLVWFVLAMQCMSTIAIVKRETNSWRWPIAMLVYMNAVAYVAALLVYQIGTRLYA